MHKKHLIVFSFFVLTILTWWGYKMLNFADRYPAETTEGSLYYQADFLRTQSELDNSSTTLKWIHKNADVDWTSFNYPAGEENDHMIKVCFYEDKNDIPHIGKLLNNGTCLYAIYDDIAIQGIDSKHPSSRKRYNWASTTEDYYILTGENSDDYQWVLSNEVESVGDDYKQLAVGELRVCLAENITSRRFSRSMRGWHPGEVHNSPVFQNTLRCYYEYGGHGDKAPTIHSGWSRQQVKILYAKLEKS